MEIRSDEVTALKAALKNGLGFTKAAKMLMFCPKQLSDFVNQTPGLKNELQQDMVYACKVLMVMSNQYLQDKQFEKWKTNNEYLKTFISRLNLWECYCPRKQVTPAKIVQVYMLYRDLEEVATAIGMQAEELNEYITTHPGIMEYMRQHRAFF